MASTDGRTDRGTPPRFDRSTRIVVVTAVVAMASGVAWFAIPRDRSTVIDVDDAVDRFRSSTAPSPVSAPASTNPPADTVARAASSTTPPTSTIDLLQPSLPDPGVYRYATTGFESIDAVGGVRHDYPAVTTITVTDDPETYDPETESCGRTLRWDALEERHEIWRLCLDGVTVVWQPTSLQYHEFFEQETPENVTCDLAVPLTDPDTGVIQQECILEDRPWSPRWEHLGMQERLVNGITVPVHHVRMIVDDTDDLPESYVQDWFVRDDGLPIEVTVDKRSVNPSPLGGVVEYLESYRITLLELDPLR